MQPHRAFVPKTQSDAAWRAAAGAHHRGRTCFRLCALLALLGATGPAVRSDVSKTAPTEARHSLGLRGLEGEPVTPSGRWVVLVFLSPECPGSNTSTPELALLHHTFAGEGASFVAVYSDPTATPASLKKHYSDYRFGFPAVHDGDQAIARRVRATYTPQAAVLAADGTLLYRGPIDDRVSEGCSVRAVARRRDLHDVLTRLVAGEKGPFDARPGAGCALPEPVPDAVP